MMAKKNLKIISMFLLNLFSLSTTFIGTFSWFVSMTKRNAEQSEFNVTKPLDLEIGYDVYSYDDETKSGVINTPIEGSTSIYSLKGYDSFIRERNETNHRIVRVDVEYKEPVQAATYLNITLTSIGNLFDEDNYVAKYISNLIEFKSFFSSHKINGVDTPVLDCEVDETSPDTIYNDVTEICKISGLYSSASFVHVDKTGGKMTATKPESTIVISSPTLIPLGSTASTLYLEYDYNETYVDFFIENTKENIDVEVLTGDEVIFESDITSIVITMGE